MLYLRSLFVLSLIVSLALLSCKKKNPPQPEPEPKPVVYTLNLAHQRNENSDQAFLSMSSATDGSQFYVSGGNNFGVGSDLTIYNPKTLQWSVVPLSWKRSDAKVIYFKGKVFVAGGKTNMVDQFRVDMYDINKGTSSFVLFGHLQNEHPAFSSIVEDRFLVFFDYDYFYVYDSASGTWETIIISSANRVAITGMAAVGNKLYLNDFNDFSTLKVFDLKSRTWSAINAVRHQSHVNLMPFEERIYFSGNRSFDALEHIDVLDVNTGQWSKITHPDGRSFYNMNIEPKSRSLIITGGRSADVDAYGNPYLKMSDDLLVYNLDTKNWQKSKMKYIRYTHTTQFVGDYFIVFGGQSIFNGYPLIKLPMEVYSIVHQLLD